MELVPCYSDNLAGTILKLSARVTNSRRSRWVHMLLIWQACLVRWAFFFLRVIHVRKRTYIPCHARTMWNATAQKSKLAIR